MLLAARKPLPKLDFDGDNHDQGDKVAAHHHHPNFVRGDWLGHVYVPVSLDGSPRLEALLDKMRRYLDKERSDVQHLRSNEDHNDEDEESLHVSLTQPIEIRAQERETFFRTAREALVARPSSSNTSTATTTLSSLGLSFSRIVVLPSNTTRRAFFALEISQSHDILLAMSQRLDETLRTAFRAREYRWPEGTRYHASFAWCPCDTLPRDAEEADGGNGDGKAPSLEELQRLADKLEQKFGDELRRSVGEVRASSACVRVGKRVQTIKLSACRLE